MAVPSKSQNGTYRFASFENRRTADRRQVSKPGFGKDLGKVAGTGFELPQETSEKLSISTLGGAESGAAAKQRTQDADLALVVEAWRTLPDPMKAGILAIVRTATAKE